jgi:outer membrane protein assembly factor BamB
MRAMKDRCGRFATLCRSLAGAAAVSVGLVACEGSPGESRIEVLSPEDASPIWDQTLPTEEFFPDSSPPPEALRIQGYDNCPGESFVSDFDRLTGAKLRDVALPRVGVDLPLVPVATTSSCPGFLQQRVTLSNGALIDICAIGAGDDALVVLSVESGTERLRVPLPIGFVETKVFGDQLLLITEGGLHIDAFSLETSEALWRWTPPEQYTYVTGGDAERVYLWQESDGETYALSLASGTVVWQKNLGCEWLSLTQGALVCGRTLRESSCEETD